MHWEERRPCTGNSLTDPKGICQPKKLCQVHFFDYIKKNIFPLTFHLIRNLCCKPPLKPGIHSRVTESWATVTCRNDEGGSGWSEGERKQGRRKIANVISILCRSRTSSLSRGLFEKALRAKKLRYVPLYSRVIIFADPEITQGPAAVIKRQNYITKCDCREDFSFLSKTE